MNREEFLTHLRDSQLLPADQLRQVEGRFGPEATPGAMAGELAGERLLTPFQVEKVLAGEARQLVLGQYRLLDELGRGGMGQVFKAYHTVMGRIVALKILAPALQADPVALGWFGREVRMLTQLQHPYIVLAYDANEANGLHFLVMEYVEGQNLQTLVKKRGPLPIRQACEIMFQSAVALQYAHEKGVVHRDIKPANLLIPAVNRADVATEGLAGVPGGDEELRLRPPAVKVVDFGLARLHGPGAAETILLKDSHGFAGTPDFVSPEQCRDVHGVDIRSDLYSLGCTFYFALTGEPPFVGGSVTEKLANHLIEPPPPVERLRPDAPADVSAVIRRLMAKNPDERFETPLALARALQPWCGPVSSWKVPTIRPSPSGRHATCPSASSPPPTIIPMSFGAKTAPELPPCATRVLSYSDPAPTVGVTSAPEVAAGTVIVASTAEAGGASTETGGRAAAKAPPPTPQGDALRLLRDAWRQWTDLVAALFDRRGRGSWDDAGYRLLYDGLIGACRRAAEACPEERRGLYRQLEEIVKPWVSLDSLARTEPEMLGSLLAHCRRGEQALGLRRPGAGVGRLLRYWAVPALTLWLLIQWGAAGFRLWTALGAGARRVDAADVLALLRPDLATALPFVLPLVLLAAVLLAVPRR